MIGLGNPGEKYKNTRHNAGFLAIDEFQKENDFPDFKLEKMFLAEISRGTMGKEKILLAKPQTFMNESGKSARILALKNKISKNNIIVIHDDMDLPLATIKAAKNRGSAGHKGVESIIEHLKSKEFIRIRIGIQPKTGKPKSPEKFVLQNFNKNEEKYVKEAVKKSVNAIICLIKNGLEKTMNDFNK
jgi:PTH1 family peptidyl-tRNA hydrolase